MNRQPPITRSSSRRLGRVALAALLAATLVGACQRQAVATSNTGETPPAATTPDPGKETTPMLPPTPTPAPTAPDPAAAGELLVLGIGQSAGIAPATTLRFDRIVSDSRCPADVQCVWAGEVRVALTLSSPSGSTSFELAGATANSATVQSFLIEMADFGPCEPGPAKAAPTAECVSLRISETAEQ